MHEDSLNPGIEHPGADIEYPEDNSGRPARKRKKKRVAAARGEASQSSGDEAGTAGFILASRSSVPDEAGTDGFILASRSSVLVAARLILAGFVSKLREDTMETVMVARKNPVAVAVVAAVVALTFTIGGGCSPGSVAGRVEPDQVQVMPGNRVAGITATGARFDLQMPSSVVIEPADVRRLREAGLNLAEAEASARVANAQREAFEAVFTRYKMEAAEARAAVEKETGALLERVESRIRAAQPVPVGLQEAAARATSSLLLRSDAS